MLFETGLTDRYHTKADLSLRTSIAMLMRAANSVTTSICCAQNANSVCVQGGNLPTPSKSKYWLPDKLQWFVVMHWLDAQSQLKEGQLHTSSIALKGALVEVVACSQDGLQEVDEALAGTHLLAANLQHLHLLPHLPPQTVSCQSCYQDVYHTILKTHPCRCNTAGYCSTKCQKACWGQPDAEGDSPLQCGGLSSHTAQKA
jgi:hypothetical protein